MRRSDTLGIRMFYVAIPVFDANHQVAAVIRTLVAAHPGRRRVNAMNRRIVLGT